MEPDTWKYQRRRARLVESLRVKGITDEGVLEAINRVPRHRFVDPALVARAYEDEALPIGLKQTISQPFTVAYQTELLGAKAGDRILEIGTGSGYQAAVLCELGCTVYSIERLQPLYERTRTLLNELGYRVITTLADGTDGWATFAPFDGIVVTAGASNVPDALLEQLALPEGDDPGGTLIIPVGGDAGQTMYRITRTGEKTFSREKSEDFLFVPLVRENG
ncbi:MAG: protein-L-isoaspartate(D-aspartate) O-methyltransferase [Rhodothermales bacterium]|nr:protein-L-isoaspartate(D-aspartate) O-methyltransferase [Rhodothermales bacterium]